MLCDAHGRDTWFSAEKNLGRNNSSYRVGVMQSYIVNWRDYAAVDTGKCRDPTIRP